MSTLDFPDIRSRYNYEMFPENRRKPLCSLLSPDHAAIEDKKQVLTR
jgi:hypothetical protein